MYKLVCSKTEISTKLNGFKLVTVDAMSGAWQYEYKK